MNGQNQENLTELFGRFMGAEDAKRAAEDIVRGEQVLRQHPAPQPDEQLVARIKSQIGGSLLRARRRHWRRMVCEAAGVAAAVLVLAAVWIGMERGSRQSGRMVAFMPGVLWDSDDIAADDTDLVYFSTQLARIENEAVALRSGESTPNGESVLPQLEIELMEIESDFWKG